MTQAHAFLFPGCDFSEGVEILEHDLPSALLRHLKALRIRTGESVSFLSGTGRIVNTACSSAKPYSFRVTSVEEHELAPTQVHLYLSPPRRDTLSQTLSQSTEMGVSKISFLLSDHNDYSQKERGPVIERAQRVLEAAIEQCRAPHLPKLNEKWITLSEALSEINTTAFFADEDLSLQGVVGTTESFELEAQSNVGLFVGPEGGWSEKERTQITENSYIRPLGLGARILKVPTACVAALYQIQILFKGNSPR